MVPWLSIGYLDNGSLIARLNHNMGGWAERGYSINIDKIGRRKRARQEIYMVFPSTASPREDARGQGQEKVTMTFQQNRASKERAASGSPRGSLNLNICLLVRGCLPVWPVSWPAYVCWAPSTWSARNLAGEADFPPLA